MKGSILPVIFSLVLIGYGCSEKKKITGKVEKPLKNVITLLHSEPEDRVDVLVDGRLFTSYLYTDTLSNLKKTVLYPIIAANGEMITRGYPIETRPNERTDHPHHIGAWFNYGDVNGLDFWGNSDAIPEENRHKMGTIRHGKIIDLKNGHERAELTVAENWVKPDGGELVKERTKFIFYAKNGKRIIDRITTLRALNDQVFFKDTKEGMFAIRTARELEHQSDRPVVLSDANGRITDVEVRDNTGVSGHYLSSEGVEGVDVWGTRAKWVALFGTLNDKDITVAIMDEPNNVGFPTYWHARGYGLFAANALGQRTFTDGKEALDFSLPPRSEATFTYRIAIFDGKASKAELASEYDAFVSR